MIQINLIPDIKLELIKQQRHRNLVISISTIVMLAVGGLIAFLGIFVMGWQLIDNSGADTAIAEKYEKYTNITDVEERITIQNQLAKIDDTHKDKAVTSRLLSILGVASLKGTPSSVSYKSFTFDKANATITLSAQTDKGGYGAAEVFKKNIEAMKIYPIVKEDDEAEDSDVDLSSPIDLASDVTLASVGTSNSEGNEDNVDFQITFTYDERVFSPELEIEKITALNKGNVTDSYKRLPESLFTEDTSKDDKDKGGDK